MQPAGRTGAFFLLALPLLPRGCPVPGLFPDSSFAVPEWLHLTRCCPKYSPGCKQPADRLCCRARLCPWGCASRAGSAPAACDSGVIQAGDACRAGFGIILRLAFVLRLHDSVLEEARAKKKELFEATYQGCDRDNEERRVLKHGLMFKAKRRRASLWLILTFSACSSSHVLALLICRNAV